MSQAGMTRMKAGHRVHLHAGAPGRFSRMVGLDFRHGYGVWIVPVLIALGCLYSIRVDEPNTPMWGYRSVRLAWTFAALGPIGAAWGSWLAGRERRARTETLIASTPTRPLVRDARALVVPVLGSLLAYIGIAAFVLGRTAIQTAWGQPVWPIVIYAGSVIAAYTIVGTIAGLLVPARVTSLVVGIGLFLFTTLSFTYLDTQSAYRYLAPFRWVGDPHAYDDVLFYGDRSGGQLLIAYALALGAVLATIAVLLFARVGRKGGMLVGLAAAIVLVPSIDAAITPIGSPATYRIAALADVDVAPRGPVEDPTLVCAGDVVETCVHKAFEGDVPAVAARVEEVLAPVIGLSGVPTRFEQRADVPSDGTVARFTATWSWSDPVGAIDDVIVSTLFVADGHSASSDRPKAQTPAQIAIALGLVRHAGGAGMMPVDISGYEFPGGDGRPNESEVEAWREDLQGIQAAISTAADRFSALPPEEQRAWLEAHWDSLRSGELTLEDLP